MERKIIDFVTRREASWGRKSKAGGILEKRHGNRQTLFHAICDSNRRNAMFPHFLPTVLKRGQKSEKKLYKKTNSHDASFLAAVLTSITFFSHLFFFTPFLFLPTFVLSDLFFKHILKGQSFSMKINGTSPTSPRHPDPFFVLKRFSI